MKTLTSISILICLLATLRADAETLHDAWETALASHRQIAAAGAELEAAGFDLERARAARRPQLGLSTNYTHLDAAPNFALGGVSAPLFAADDFVRAGAELGLPLYTGGAIRAGIDAAEAGARAAADRLAIVTQDIKLGTAERYVAVLEAESAVAVAGSIVASLASHTENTRKRFEAGAIPRNEYLAASVTLANAEQRRLAAGNALDYARADYNRFLGRPLDSAVALDPALAIDDLVPADRDLDGLILLAIERRPQLDAIASQARALQRQSAAARAAARPQLAVTGGYMFLENEFLDDDAFWMAGVSLSWRLFDGGESRRRAAALASRAAALGHSRADLETSIALEVRRAWHDRIEAQSRLAVAERAVDQANENLRVVRNRYAAGAGTHADVLDAEALREQALGNRDAARFELVLAGLRLARAAGTL
ncbi:MAG: TolC family protein [Woeseiaceae bacterium]|nr:TolC family protein [Woeseiaceae bacterium]